jgi:dihydroxy-acid dehydratase
VGGALALLQTGDRIRIDLLKREANLLVSDAELASRRAALEAAGGYVVPPAQTPWQELHRQITGQYPGGAVIEAAIPYQRIAQTRGLPRDSH